MALRRLHKERQELARHAADGGNISGGPVSEEDPFHWQATIVGPEGSPYAGGAFVLDIKFPSDYPFNPPGIKMTTPIYHPNISSTGGFSNNLWSGGWSPAFTLTKVVLRHISSWMEEPRKEIAGYRPEVYNLYFSDVETDREKCMPVTHTLVVRSVVSPGMLTAALFFFLSMCCLRQGNCEGMDTKVRSASRGGACTGRRRACTGGRGRAGGRRRRARRGGGGGTGRR